MTTWGVTMVRDEVDIIEHTIRHMATQVDGLIVADNMSEDGTRVILDLLHDELPLTVITDHDPAYYQAEKMTVLAEDAYDRGATWIVPFDADEHWTHDSGLPIRDVLAGVDAGRGAIVPTRLWNYYTTSIDEDSENPFERITWRMHDPQPLGKVMIQWQPGMGITQGNHSAEGGFTNHVAGFEVRHYPYRSAEQFVRKVVNGAAAYALTDLPADVGQHWREYGRHYELGGEQRLREIYETYFHYLSPSSAGLVHDPAPL